MGLNLTCSGSIWIDWIRCWQIKNLATQITSVICRELLLHHRQQCFHVKLHKLMCAHVRLKEMSANQTWFLGMAAHQACGAQHLSYLRQFPQISKSSVHKKLNQSKTAVPRYGTVQQVVEHILCDGHRHEWSWIQAVVGHSKLPKGQTDVVLSNLVDLWVAHAPMSCKNQFDQKQRQALRPAP